MEPHELIVIYPFTTIVVLHEAYAYQVPSDRMDASPNEGAFQMEEVPYVHSFDNKLKDA